MDNKPSKTRQAIDMYMANPGISQYAVCKQIGISSAALSRALKALQTKADRVQRVMTGEYDPEAMRRLTDEGRDQVRVAFQLLEQNPGMTVAEAARQVGVTKASLYALRDRMRKTQAIRCSHCGQILPYLKGVIHPDV